MYNRKDIEEKTFGGGNLAKQAISKNSKYEFDYGDSSKVESLSEYDRIGAYLKSTRKYPLLTREEELALGSLCQEGDTEAKDKLILSNLRLVVNVAKKYTNKGLSLEELIQEGNLGLIKAVEHFDPKRGCRFSTYGVWWIRQAIVNAICDKNSTIKVPRRFYGVIQSVHDVINESIITTGKSPNVEEISKLTNLPKDKVIKALSWSGKTVSLDNQSNSHYGSENIQTLELSDDVSLLPDEEADIQLRKELLLKLVSMLPAREKDVLTMKYGLKNQAPMDYEAISKALKVSVKRVEFYEKRAITKLKKLANQPVKLLPQY